MNLEVICDVQEVADEHYYSLSDDNVNQWASRKVNAVLRLKWNNLSWVLSLLALLVQNYKY